MHEEQKIGIGFMWIFCVLGIFMIIVGILMALSDEPIGKAMSIIGWILGGVGFFTVGLSAKMIGEERSRTSGDV